MPATNRPWRFTYIREYEYNTPLGAVHKAVGHDNFHQVARSVELYTFRDRSRHFFAVFPELARSRLKCPLPFRSLLRRSL